MRDVGDGFEDVQVVFDIGRDDRCCFENGGVDTGEEDEVACVGFLDFDSVSKGGRQDELCRTQSRYELPTKLE